MTLKDHHIGLLFGLTVPLISVAAFTAARMAPAAAIDPLALSILRFIGALPVVLILWLSARRTGAVLPGWPKLLVVGLLGGPLYAYALYSGFVSGSVAVGGAVLPASLILLTLLLGGERWGGLRLAGVALVLGGIAVLAGGRSGGSLTGLAIFAAAGGIWAVVAILARRWQIPAAGIALITVVAGGLVCLPLAGLTRWTMGWELALMQAVVQGGLNAGVAVWLYGQSLVRLGASRTALFVALIPILSSFAGSLFFDEMLGASVVLAACLVSGGIVLSLRIRQ